jgi:hypothetical protein
MSLRISFISLLSSVMLLSTLQKSISLFTFSYFLRQRRRRALSREGLKYFSRTYINSGLPKGDIHNLEMALLFRIAIVLNMFPLASAWWIITRRLMTPLFLSRTRSNPHIFSQIYGEFIWLWHWNARS